MQLDSPIDTLAAAYHSALLVDLQAVQYRQMTVQMRQQGIPSDQAPLAERRPRGDECNVVMFMQMWGSTALGFGGMGGAAMTPAYTVIVKGPAGDACVYFMGRFAYRVPTRNAAFMADMAAQRMASVQNANKYMTA